MTHTQPSADAATSPDERPFLEFQAKKMLHTAQGKELLDIRFQLAKGQVLAVYGPSGAGKTTLLRILAGLTEVTTGHIRLGGETWLDTAGRKHLPTRRRAIGFVFQDFALFPNLTVRQQLEYALPPPEKDAPTGEAPIIGELLTLMELEALQHHRPALLSGGQQQRVALARAIARRPSLLLLDEPLSALDDEMRNKLQEYILKIQQRYHLTTILVSHHLPEILRLADTAILLKKGRIETLGPPAAIFTPPPPDLYPASTAGSSFHPNPSSFRASGTILRIEPNGSGYTIHVQCAGTEIDIPATAAEAATLRPGQQVTVYSSLFAPQLLP